MHNLGWLSSQDVSPKAFSPGYAFSVKSCSILLLLLLSCLLYNPVSASPTEFSSSPTPAYFRNRNYRRNNNDLDEQRHDQQAFHPQNHGAGRSSHSSAYQRGRSPPPAAIPLTTQRDSEFLPDPALAGPVPSRRSINDWTVADFILVSSIDGSLHARDRHTGLEVWEIPGDKPLVQVSTAETLVNRTRNVSPSDPCDDCDVTWIVEPLGEGTLYYFTPLTGLQQLPISIKELVMQSPFSLRGDDKIYIGSHTTTLYSIESSTGKILKAYGASKPNLSQNACGPQRNPFFLEDDEDDYEDLERPVESGSFMIGRTGMFWDSHNPLLTKQITFSRFMARTKSYGM